ncbi:MAG TPA: NAD(P)H-dependent oxidoreductase [Nonomuraea sp.]|nr:NAD(P)H-dependent oxidoreductase [Nonomuraea sp.]
MISVAIIIGSTRPGRVGEAVAHWVRDLAAKRDDAEFEVVDLKDFDLPLLDEVMPASTGRYDLPHTRSWAAKIASFDAYVFVTPEYNRSTSAALKNAIDFLYAEWNNKAAGFVGYGVNGGTRAVEHLRLMMAELQIADVRAQVTLSLLTDFEDYSLLRPAAQQEHAVEVMLDQVIAWGGSLRGLRRQALSRR